MENLSKRSPALALLNSEKGPQLFFIGVIHHRTVNFVSHVKRRLKSWGSLNITQLTPTSDNITTVTYFCEF